MELFDFTLIGQMAIIVTTIVQGAKFKKPFSNIDGQILSFIVGILVMIYKGVESGAVSTEVWPTMATVVAIVVNGLITGGIACGLFNLQDVLPIKNIMARRKVTDPTEPAPSTATPIPVEVVEEGTIKAEQMGTDGAAMVIPPSRR